jgi:hypothetical protein
MHSSLFASLPGLQGLQDREMVQMKTSYDGLREGWTRATFILREDYLEKIKSLAYWKRKNIKEVMDHVLEEYLKGKKIKSRRSK